MSDISSRYEKHIINITIIIIRIINIYLYI